MSSEYATNFTEKKPDEKMNAAVGPKEMSGFVLNKEMEDVLTGVPGERWLLNDSRPTDISDYKLRFQPFTFPRVSFPFYPNFP
jgi:hypothetical protein